MRFSDDQTTTRLVVKATGSWRIEVRPITTARRMGSKIGGNGDDVIYYPGEGAIAKINGNKARDNFIVQSYGVDSGNIDLLVNETDPYSGEVEWPANSLIVINATGPWAIGLR